MIFLFYFATTWNISWSFKLPGEVRNGGNLHRNSGENNLGLSHKM